jgi:hypothetical protein
MSPGFESPCIFVLPLPFSLPHEFILVYSCEVSNASLCNE